MIAKKTESSKNNFYVILIVAIVAIIGIIVILSGKGNIGSPSVTGQAVNPEFGNIMTGYDPLEMPSLERTSTTTYQRYSSTTWK